MSMYKPELKRTYDHSTAVTDLRHTGTYNTNRSPLSNKTTANLNRPSVSSFEIIPAANIKPSTFLKNENKKLQQNERQVSWTDTRDIQAIIARNIETDIEQSMQRNFGVERYFLGPERACAGKELPIPYEVEGILRENQQRPISEKVQTTYGYLSYSNSIYYIIGRDLYVFRIDELKEREEKQLKSVEPLKIQPFMPVRLNQNCRKIHEVNFQDNSYGFSSIKMPQKRALILEYPYQLDIVNYKFEQSFSNPHQNASYYQFSCFTIINIGLNLKIQSLSTDFITITPTNTLLYIDENRNLMNLILYNQEGKVKGKIKRRSLFQFKETFISKNHSNWRNIKRIIFQSSRLNISIQPPKKSNLALVYDERRSRVYTWTLKGDRTTAIQQLKRQINVYEFVPTINGHIKCLLTIPEEQILLELEYPIDPPNVLVSGIMKADLDYNQQASLIVLLSNGNKHYIDIINDQCKFRWKYCSPSVENLKLKIDKKDKDLFKVAELKAGKDFSTTMQKAWGQKLQVDLAKNSHQKIFSFFNDRNLSVGLVRSDNRLGMYVTLRKNYDKNDHFDVIQVKFKSRFFQKRLESYPLQNQIFETKCASLHSENSQKISALEQFEYMQQLVNGTQSRLTKPKSEGCHDLLRQVHHGPRFFTYLSSNQIASFAILRPIDIVYYFVKYQKEMFCQSYLPSIINLEAPEICYMLLQIYSASPGTSYFISKKYTLKIEKILLSMHQSSQRSQNSQNRENSYDRTYPIKDNFTRMNRSMELNEDQNFDQLREMKTEQKDDQLKMNIRKLFANFSGLQKTLDHNVFENIKIKSSSISSEEIDFDYNFRNLKTQHKIQAKNCLVYVSRVLYPFWNAKCLTLKKGQVYLLTIKDKVQELTKIVELLKFQSNEYWRFLDDFLQKLRELLEIFTRVPKIPYDLTLSEAMQKKIEYFQPFIFESLQYNYDPKFIDKFKQEFPIYITNDFYILIMLYISISKLTNARQINRCLERLSCYPQYFIDYLKKEKPYLDFSALNIRDHHAPVIESVDIEIPMMPFANLIPFLFEKIQNPTVKMTHKFKYLEIVKQKIKENQNKQVVAKQITNDQKLNLFQKDYEQKFKSLKFQQKCKEVIEQIAEENMKSQQSKSSNQSQKPDFLSNLFTKLTNLFSENQGTGRRQNLSIASYQTKQKIHEQHRMMFQKLNYILMGRKQFEGIIQSLKNSYLEILYICLFWNKNSKQAQISERLNMLAKRYAGLVRQGINKYGNSVNAQEGDRDEWEKYRKLVGYLKSHVTKIISLLISTKAQVHVASLYDGLVSELSLHNFTLLSITMPSQKEKVSGSESFYSIPMHLAEMGFDKKQLTSYILRTRLTPIFTSKQIQHSLDKPRVIKKWVYECCMLADMVVKYKSEDWSKLVKTINDFMVVNEDLLDENGLKVFGGVLRARKEQLQNGVRDDQDVII